MALQVSWPVMWLLKLQKPKTHFEDSGEKWRILYLLKMPKYKMFQTIVPNYLFLNKSRDIPTCAMLCSGNNKIMRFMTSRQLLKSRLNYNARNSVISESFE